mgnify:CR=1 FL=1
MDIFHQILKKYYGYSSFRPLQLDIIQSVYEGHDTLALMPTGGGKSITFQVPALMSGESSKGLTIVISPLQSLMKDQVDNLEKAEITDAVTINGLLDPIERAKSFERVEDGSASILYISPESLRSRTIERLILGRNVVRFVIDEAHCISEWGHDFRPEYRRIRPIINEIGKRPLIALTATATPKVQHDIQKNLGM